MRRIFPLIFVLLVFYNTGYAQDVEWAMTGLRSSHSFCNGVAAIIYENSNVTKIINRNGDEIREYKDNICINYADDSCQILMKLKGKKASYYLADSVGNKLSKEYNQIIPWGNYFAINDKDKWCLIDRNGKEILKFNHFDSFYDDQSNIYNSSYNSDYAMFTVDEGEVILDSNGHIVLKDNMVSIDEELLTNAFPIIYGENWLYVKSSGKTMEFKDKYVHSNPLCDYFVLTDYWGHEREYFDFNCQPISQSLLTRNGLGISVISVDNKYMLTDANGNRISNEVFDDISPLLWVNGKMAVKCDEKWGYISEEGKWIISPKYESADPFTHGVAIVNKEDKPSIIDNTGHILFEISNAIYNYGITFVDGEPLLLYYGLSNGFYNLKTRQGIDNLTEMPSFHGKYAIIEPRSSYKKGVCLNYGKIVVPCEYDFIKSISEDVIVASKWINDYIYDSHGNLKLDCESLGINIIGHFSSGVAPVIISGAGENNAGYIYNIYSCPLDETIGRFGQLGDTPISIEMQELVQKRQYFVNYHQNMGKKAMGKKQYDAAIKHFNSVIEVHSSYAPAFLGKGICLMESGKNSEAIVCLEDAKNCNYQLEGVNYALALLYYQEGNYSEALKCCNIVRKKDPYYDVAQQMKEKINYRKQIKRQQRLEMFMAIMYGLNQMSGTLQTILSNGSSGHFTPTTPTLHSNSTHSGSNQRECSSCHGTGYSSARERAAFYSYSEEIYDNEPCEICGDRSDHYHKPCPVCNGRGWVNF